MSISREYVEKLIVEILREKQATTFEELRDAIEDVYGLYIDGVTLRKILVELLFKKVVCKYPSESRRKFIFKLCHQ